MQNMLDEQMQCIPGADESAAAAGCWPCIRFGEPTLTQGSLCEAPAAKTLCHCKLCTWFFPTFPPLLPSACCEPQFNWGQPCPKLGATKKGMQGSQTPTINNLLPQSSQATASYHGVPSSHLQSCPFSKDLAPQCTFITTQCRVNLLLFNMTRSKAH